VVEVGHLPRKLIKHGVIKLSLMRALLCLVLILATLTQVLRTLPLLTQDLDKLLLLHTVLLQLLEGLWRVVLHLQVWLHLIHRGLVERAALLDVRQAVLVS